MIAGDERAGRRSSRRARWRATAALITGGGTGLGRESAFELARCGAEVTIAGRREEVLEQTVERAREELGEAGERIGWVAGDVREPERSRAARRERARAPRPPRRARQQRRRAVLQPGRADRGKGVARRLAAERGGDAEHVRGRPPACLHAVRRGDGDQRHAVSAPRHARDGALGRRAGDRGGAHEGAGRSMGGLEHSGRRGRGGSLRDRGDGEVPGERARGGLADGADPAPRRSRSSTPG